MDADSEEYTRQHRQRVRDRTRNGTKDLSILFDRMEDRDIKQVFEPDREALSETAELIDDILEDIKHRGRRVSLEHRHALQEISELIEEIEELSKEEQDLEDDLGSLQDRNRGLSDFSDGEMQEQRDTLEVELRNVAAHREELISDIRLQLEDIAESLQNQADWLTKGYKRFEQIPRKDLSIDWQRQLEEIEDRFIEERKQAQGLLNIVREVREALEDDRVPTEDLLYLRDEIEQHAQGRRMRKRNLNREKPPLHVLLRRFQEELQKELDEPEFDPGLRDDFVRSMAFFFRVSEVLGTDTEDLIEEAYITMFEQEHPDEVLDHVLVSSEADNREKAAERAAGKPVDEHLSNAELRSLAEDDLDTLVQRYSHEADVSAAELAHWIQSDPEILERGLKIVDTDPKNPDSAAVPDMVARDNRGQIVVMEFKTSLANVNGSSERLQQLVKDYGGKDRVRGMIVVPESAVDESEDVSNSVSDPIEIQTVPVEQ